ncbi:hypothetical protein MsAc7_05630 [Methanolapillus millepedarum]|uniref:Uncharacterized protein n=1 Tax=Methanolapillus millepedarum TaxID=3028296 RepID=A0AA96ZTV5_9EURY|nr:hypothetical protein MsAc7_05630 [Methanosarcinaceae archaeon Ac7]
MESEKFGRDTRPNFRGGLLGILKEDVNIERPKGPFDARRFCVRIFGAVFMKFLKIDRCFLIFAKMCCHNARAGPSKSKKETERKSKNKKERENYSPANNFNKTAFCACSRFSAWSKTTECGPSMAPAEISRPRCAGRQCITITSGFETAISSSLI